MLNAIGNFLGVILGFIVNIVGDYAWSIIIFTILVRLCLMPLMIKQIKSTKAMQDIQPKMQEIQEKYNPIKDCNIEGWNKLGIKTKYYNTEIQKACFALPNYVKEKLED